MPTTLRMRSVIAVAALCLLAGVPAFAQMETATLSGVIQDPNGGVVPDVEVTATRIETGTAATTKTNGAGIYFFTGLMPGHYHLMVRKPGFKEIAIKEFQLYVQDKLEQNFALEIGSVSETVTVTASGGLNVNTQDAAVSTVIDRNFMEALPLNGRSFNTLLQLTPGVVIAPTGNGPLSPGQFSIAGQRTDANNFTIDGASANFGVALNTAPGQSGTGSAQAFSALGGTSSLVSVEGLQEFRIETSSFAPEFGRSPGGQVILTTRSGTNAFHGGMYEYFRNNVLDANDWFANQAGIARAPERHNDFGGFLGGPIWRDKTFFFLSYEAARLRLPQSQVINVPSAYARTAAPAALAPYLNANPLPDDRTITPGVYISPFTGVWSNAATLNAGSVRIDHTLNSRFSVFGRYNDAPSELAQRSIDGLSTVNSSAVNTRTVTLGFNAFLTSRMSNTFRGNYSTQQALLSSALDSFGGAVPIASNLLLGSLSSQDNRGGLSINITGPAYQTGPVARNTTRQINFLDNVSFSLGTHQMKYGVDYLVIDLHTKPSQHFLSLNSPTVQKFLSSGGQVTVSGSTAAFSQLRAQSLSLYAQDTWKASPRVTITYGVRWDLAPAPTALGATTLASWTNVDTPSQIALAPPGTSVWRTTYGNFAPRIGVAYALTDSGDFVLRAGGGLFYDPGVGVVASLAIDFPNVTNLTTRGVQLPIADPTPLLPVLSTAPPFKGSAVVGFDPNLTRPRSYQWNVALEKSFGAKQFISATYLAQAGRDLLRQEALFRPNPNFASAFLLTRNDSRSNYNALQVQYRRLLSARFQALLNYSWSHSLDNASNDVIVGLSNSIISAASDYASSNFDVRHSFSGALTYALPAAAKSGPFALLTRDWSIDTVIVARSGFPFNGLVFGTSPVPGGFVLTRPDRVPGQPVWVSAPTAPGGKMLNVTYDPNTGAITGGAFAIPSATRQGTEGRNDIPGFGLAQVDLSIARKFSITERLNLQFRADAFNVFNHPNFANPSGALSGDPLDLQATSMLNRGLGQAGLNPLFQEGGPRSLQLSLKLIF